MVPSSEGQVHGALVVGTVAGFTSGTVTNVAASKAYAYKVMKLEVDADPFRQLIAIDLGARGAVLEVGAFAPRARAPPQVRGGRDVRASRPLNSLSRHANRPFKEGVLCKGITLTRTEQCRPSEI